MIEGVQIAFGLIVVLGCLSAAVSRNPFDKLISLAVLAGGVMPFIIDYGYLDVAIVVALVTPVTTIFLLLAAWRGGS